MQEITKTKCSSTSIPVGTEGRLKDTRDGKIYWVAKLKDGLCWMTQNLDYDGGGIPGISFADYSDPAQYYDPGEYVYINGTATSTCSNATISTSLKNCAEWKLENGIGNTDLKNYVDVAGWIETDELYFVNSEEYVGTDGISVCKKIAGALVGDAKYEQCHIYYYLYLSSDYYKHYSIGNYYNWKAATNGTSTSATTAGAVAGGSICPNGWSLPIGGNANIGSFGKLMNGLVTDTSVVTGPYYFVYGGDISNDALNNVGSRGHYWTATASSSIAAYDFTLNGTGIDLSSSRLRYGGISVRCVAR